MCLGSAYVAAYLQQNGFTVEQYQTGEALNLRECTAQIAAKKPRVVGFTVYHSNYSMCRLIAKALKEAYPGIIILFGGPTTAVQSGAILENNDFVDICVRNGGEETCLQLLELFENSAFDLKKVPLEEVAGITYRRGGSGGREYIIHENPDRDIFLSKGRTPGCLDKYPSPYLNGIIESAGLGIITARGCDRFCVYCNCAVVSKRIIATHSVDRVIAELDYISRKMGVNNPVDVFDDTFTFLPGRAVEICDKIIENKIKLPLNCGTRCDCVDEELLEKLKEAGFKTVGFSLESAVPRILRIIGKVQSPHTRSDPGFEKEKEFIEKFKKYIVYAKKIGIETVYSSIMVGLPSETSAEGRRTVELIRSLGRHIDFYIHNVFHVHPGTPIFAAHKKYGLKLLPYSNGIHYRTIHSYDTGRLEPAPNSVLEKENITHNKKSIKNFSLILSEAKKESGNVKSRGYVYGIILFADLITGKLIEWLQGCLAINGHIIQVYSGLERARRFHEDNKRVLIENESPSNYHSEYYRVRVGAVSPTGCSFFCGTGVVTLIPYLMHIFGESYGVKTDITGTCSVLDAAAGSGIDPTQTVCIDREKEDTLRLHRLLVEISRLQSSGRGLFDLPVYPYFAGLCRWERGAANCAVLETLIVDDEENVRTCWQGEPVGRVGQSLSEIAANISSIRSRVEAERGCPDCSTEAECAKCIFPGSLSGDEYCELRRGCDSGDSVQLLRALDIFKL